MSCLCVDMIAHACAVRVSLKNVYSIMSAWSLLSNQSTRRQRRPPRLSVTPIPGEGSGHSSGKATARGSPGARVSHWSVSAVALTTTATMSRKPWSGVGARGWGVGGWCRRSALPGIGTPRRAPPERRHSHVTQSAAPSLSVLRLKVFS